MNAAAPTILTLTGNLLAERTLEFATWSAGKTQRASREIFQVGGKGINVSKMLNRLGTPNTALCFSGGATGTECEAWLRARGFHFRAFPTATATRSGTVVRSGSVAETTFLGPDCPPDAAAVQACATFLEAQPDGAVLALCGSFPGWNESYFDVLRETLKRWLHRGVLVADTYGAPLVWLATLPLALVKLNAAELRALAPDLRQLPASSAVERWVVSDGAGPLQLLDRDKSLHSLSPPVVHEVSATGSGDVLFAALIHGLYVRSMGLREAVAFALPYAAANAAHPGIAEFPESALIRTENLG